MRADLDRLIDLLDAGYNRKSWHGTNLRGSIRGLTADQAAWRDRPDGHTIADLVVHCAYWKYVVRRRLLGEKRGSFPLKGSNWFRLAEPLTAITWQEYVALLDDQHRALRDAVAGLTGAALAAAPGGSTLSNRVLIQGVAFHDVYHAGQIQALKGAQKHAPRRNSVAECRADRPGPHTPRM
jgi:uncharacterized damage-inducible protein DinB